MRPRTRLAAYALASLFLAGCAAPAAAPTQNEPRQHTTWAAEACTGFSAVWQVALDTLRELVGPHWEPSEGATAGMGTYVVFVFDCPDTRIDHASTGPVDGAFALVRIDTPATTRGLDGFDQWTAVVGIVLDENSPLVPLFRGHGFDVKTGSVTAGFTHAPAGTSIDATAATPQGTLHLAAAASNVDSTPNPYTNVIVGPSSTTFSAFHGPETMDRATRGGATTRSEGATWATELDLDAATPRIALDERFAWTFTFVHEAW